MSVWGEDAKNRAARAAAGVLSGAADSERFLRFVGKVQHLRTLVDEGASAFWHFGAMPSRQDVRALQRRVQAIRRRVAELDRAVATLEARLDDADPRSLRDPRVAEGPALRRASGEREEG